MNVSSYDAFFGIVLKIVLILAIALIVFFIVRALRIFIGEKRARLAVSSDRFKNLSCLAKTQSEVIDSLINEMSGSPASYSAAVSQELQARIYAVHDLARETEGKESL